MADKSAALIPVERIEQKIFLIRGEKVLLDADLAALYGVPTKILTRAVRRNPERFPPDFMFQLTKQEVADLRFHLGTSSWGGRRYLPYAFTEHGAAMISAVLHSDRAVAVSIEIVRAFVHLRRWLSSHEEIAAKLAEHDQQLQLVFHAVAEISDRVDGLLAPDVPTDNRIGFVPPEPEDATPPASPEQA